MAATWLRAWAAFLPSSANQTLQLAAPALFRDADTFLIEPYGVLAAQFFGTSDQRAIEDSVFAGLLMQLHCCLQDQRIDGELPRSVSIPAAESLSNLLLAESLSIFSRVAAHPQFPTSVRSAFSDLATAYHVEAAGGIERLNQADRMRTFADRAAPLHILISALGYQSGHPEKIEACSEIGRRYILWFQILDDCTDWQKDLARKRHSYLLLQLEPLMQGRPFAEWRPDDVETALFLLGGIEAVFEEGCCHLQEALKIVREHGAAESQADRPDSLASWLTTLIEAQKSIRAECVTMKRRFLREVAGDRGARDVA
jgi:hypothetical protein